MSMTIMTMMSVKKIGRSYQVLSIPGMKNSNKKCFNKSTLPPLLRKCYHIALPEREQCFARGSMGTLLGSLNVQMTIRSAKFSLT